jgi:hypothetical protein
MDCPSCRAPMVTFGVPVEFRQHVPESAAHAALCPECLAFVAAETSADEPRFDRISSSFPPDARAAVADTPDAFTSAPPLASATASACTQSPSALRPTRSPSWPANWETAPSQLIGCSAPVEIRA